MATRKSDADALAANYENLIKQHRDSAQEVISLIQQTLTNGDAYGSGLSADTKAGLEQALAYAQKISTQQSAAGKSGKTTQAATVSAESQAEKTVAGEGNPITKAGKGQTSVFGQMYNSNATLTTQGEQFLAAALGSKYLINVNNKVNVSNDAKGLGALGALIKPGLTAAQVLTTMMFNQDQGTITAIQRQLVAAGYLDPLHTTNLQIGTIGSVNDPTLQALANLLESGSHGTPVQKMLAAGTNSRQGKDFANLWDSVVGGQPFTVHGDQTSVSSPESLADSLRKTSTGEGGGSGVLSGGAGRNPTTGENASFINAAQQFQMEHPEQVTTSYEPQPGLGVSGFTRFPLQKSQSTSGGADAAAMDQFTYNWLLQNMGPDVAAQGGATVLAAFNQLLGLNAAGTGSAGSSAAGGAA